MDKNKLERLSPKEEGKKEIGKLFEATAWGLEHIRSTADIAGPLKSLEGNPEEWLEMVGTQLTEVQRWATALKDSIANRKVDSQLEALIAVSGNNEEK